MVPSSAWAIVSPSTLWFSQEFSILVQDGSEDSGCVWGCGVCVCGGWCVCVWGYEFYKGEDSHQWGQTSLHFLHCVLCIRGPGVCTLDSLASPQIQEAGKLAGEKQVGPKGWEPPAQVGHAVLVSVVRIPRRNTSS